MENLHTANAVTLRSSSGRIVMQWDFRELQDWLEERGRVYMGEEQKELNFPDLSDDARRLVIDLLEGFSRSLADLEVHFYAPGFDDAIQCENFLGTDTLLFWESRIGHIRDLITAEITRRKYPPSKGYGPASEQDLKMHKRS